MMQAYIDERYPRSVPSRENDRAQAPSPAPGLIGDDSNEEDDDQGDQLVQEFELADVGMAALRCEAVSQWLDPGEYRGSGRAPKPSQVQFLSNTKDSWESYRALPRYIQVERLLRRINALFVEYDTHAHDQFRLCRKHC
jgi:hypothetical protein